MGLTRKLLVKPVSLVATIASWHHYGTSHGQSSTITYWTHNKIYVSDTIVTCVTCESCQNLAHLSFDEKSIHPSTPKNFMSDLTSQRYGGASPLLIPFQVLALPFQSNQSILALHCGS
jgi:hypothetical protein